MAPVLATERYWVYGMNGHVYNKLFIFVCQPLFLKIIGAAFFFDPADFTAVAFAFVAAALVLVALFFVVVLVTVAFAIIDISFPIYVIRVSRTL